MPRMVAVVIIGLVKICAMWITSVLVVIPWTISQENHLHLLGIIMLGGGAIVMSAVLTVKIAKHCWRNFFPGKTT